MIFHFFFEKTVIYGYIVNYMYFLYFLQYHNMVLWSSIVNAPRAYTSVMRISLYSTKTLLRRQYSENPFLFEEPFDCVILSTIAFAPSRPISWFLWWSEEGRVPCGSPRRLIGGIYSSGYTYMIHKERNTIFCAYNATARRMTAVRNITFTVYIFLSSLVIGRGKRGVE